MSYSHKDERVLERAAAALVTRAGHVLLLPALAAIAAAAPVDSDAQRAAAPPEPEAQRVAPYAATPEHVVTEMLKLARVGPADFVVDLGSGDGRLVIAAVKEFGARGGFGVDIDEKLVAFANAKAAEAGVADRVQFFARDLFATDVSAATVVTVYLFPGVMGRVRDKLRAELAPGSRVVSHDFAFPDWRAERVAIFLAPEKRDTVGRSEAVLFLYAVPELGSALR